MRPRLDPKHREQHRTDYIIESVEIGGKDRVPLLFLVIQIMRLSLAMPGVEHHGLRGVLLGSFLQCAALVSS